MALQIRRAFNLLRLLNRPQGADFPTVDATQARAQMARLERNQESVYADLTTRMIAGRLSLDEWADQFARSMREYHLQAAIIAKGGAQNLTAADSAIVQAVNGEQFTFFLGFRRDVLNLDLPNNEAPPAGRLTARARLYAGAGNEVFSRVLANVQTRGVQLPFHPGVDTQCQRNCTCWWDITALENGDIRCIWRLRLESVHCETCPERARAASAGNPLIVRNGEIVDAGRFTAATLFA